MSKKNYLKKKKKTTVEPGWYGQLGEMPSCLYHPDGRNKWALRKNVQYTCCIDIKTMADKEEEG